MNHTTATLNSHPFLPLIMKEGIPSLDSENFDSVKYRNGEHIFDEGTTPHALYYVGKGRIKLFGVGTDGKEQIFKVVDAGSFFGYKDLMADSRYTNSAVAMIDAEIFYLTRQDFFEMINLDHQFATYFTHLICQDLANAERQLVSFAYKPVRGRLADALLSLYDPKHADAIMDRKWIQVSRNDLASMIGTAKETVIRLLSEFKKEHLIDGKGRAISICDPAGLNKISQLY